MSAVECRKAGRNVITQSLQNIHLCFQPIITTLSQFTMTLGKVRTTENVLILRFTFKQGGIQGRSTWFRGFSTYAPLKPTYPLIFRSNSSKSFALFILMFNRGKTTATTFCQIYR